MNNVIYEKIYLILLEWLNNIVDKNIIREMLDKIYDLKEKTFENILYIVNSYIGLALNYDGGFDGIALEIEELFIEGDKK